MINEALLKSVRSDMKKAMDEVGKKHSIIFSIGVMSYNATEFSFKTNSTVLGGRNRGDLARDLWNECCDGYDLKPEWFGMKVVVSPTISGTIIGIKPRSNKYPILVDCGGGKVYKLRSYTVIQQCSKL